MPKTSIENRLVKLELEARTRMRPASSLFLAGLEVTRYLRHEARDPALERFQVWMGARPLEACPVNRSELYAVAVRLKLTALKAVCADPSFWHHAPAGWGASGRVEFLQSIAQA
jgi:hypothetical protein